MTCADPRATYPENLTGTCTLHEGDILACAAAMWRVCEDPGRPYDLLRTLWPMPGLHKMVPTHHS